MSTPGPASRSTHPAPPPRTAPIVVRLAACGALLAGVTACTSTGTPAPTATPAATATSSTTPSPAPSAAPPSAVDALTLEQQVGQLIMVGIESTAPAETSYAAVREHHVGNVFLAGRSSAGVEATAATVATFTDLVSPETTGGVPLWVATDQEGGSVQVLRGPGFSQIPSAVDQSAGTPAALESEATAWGTELVAAGVNMNLAPVYDVVPAGTADQNPPIGVFGRQYGSTAEDVAAYAGAFAAGMTAAGVDTTPKHFPGLGLVDGNTDVTADVTDDVTDASSASVAAFRTGIEDGARLVMMSTAVYTQLDPENPAAYSSTIIDGLLRDDLGFEGVCITDDVSAAAQVASIDPGERAVRTIDAGCDIVLASASPELVPEMVDAILDRARIDEEFAAKVETSAARVLAAKERLG